MISSCAQASQQKKEFPFLSRWENILLEEKKGRLKKKRQKGENDIRKKSMVKTHLKKSSQTPLISGKGN